MAAEKLLIEQMTLRQRKKQRPITTAVFDTLKVARQLQDASVEVKQAEAIVLAIGQSHENAASKADIAVLKTDMALMEARLMAAFSSAINRMLMGQLVVAGLLFAALKLF